jgi:hypothetical protein
VSRMLVKSTSGCVCEGVSVRETGGMSGRRLNICTGFNPEREPEKGVSCKRPRTPATCRLGVDRGAAGGKVPERLLGEKIFLWVTKECCCWATKEDKLWLGHSSAQLFLAPTWR